MTIITFKGNPIHTAGSLPTIGNIAPDFTLTKTNLSEISLSDLKNKRVLINIFPSLDTPTCATSVRKFNEKASQLNNTVVLCVSADLPFAQARFCGAEGLNNVLPVSIFRHPEFGNNYGVTITEGVLKGLLSRAVIALDENSKIIYTEQVAEIANEPNYERVLQSLISPI